MASVHCRLYVTGRLVVEGPAGALGQEALPGRQGRLTIAHLALARSEPVPRDALAATLWPEHGPPALDLALSAVVSKIRGALAQVGLPGVLHSVAGCYELRLPPDAWVDAEVAAIQLDRAEGALRRDDVAGAWAAATVASAILRRPFLPGEDGEWPRLQRTRFEAQRLRSLDCLAEAWLRRGEGGLAQRVAEEAAGIAPFREATHRLLMRAHLAQGNRAEALLAFHRCRQLLVAELGVEPAPATQAVYAEALAQGDA